MLTGLPPFYTANREELFERIKFSSLKYPYSISPQVRSLLEGLFQKNPEKRLGYGSDDAKAIKEHPWFSNVNWSAMIKKEIKPPFVPLINSEMDITHFDSVNYRNFVWFIKENLCRNSLKHQLNL